MSSRLRAPDARSRCVRVVLAVMCIALATGGRPPSPGVSGAITLELPGRDRARFPEGIVRTSSPAALDEVHVRIRRRTSRRYTRVSTPKARA